MVYIIKQIEKEQYFFKKHMISGYKEAMTFTNNRDEALTYDTQEKAELDLKWSQDPEYQVVEK